MAYTKIHVWERVISYSKNSRMKYRVTRITEGIRIVRKRVFYKVPRKMWPRLLCQYYYVRTGVLRILHYFSVYKFHCWCLPIQLTQLQLRSLRVLFVEVVDNWGPSLPLRRLFRRKPETFPSPQPVYLWGPPYVSVFFLVPYKFVEETTYTQNVTVPGDLIGWNVRIQNVYTNRDDHKSSRNAVGTLKLDNTYLITFILVRSYTTRKYFTTHEDLLLLIKFRK